MGFAQIPFNTSPSWISNNFPKYSTGCAWADINADGLTDLVVSNGNNMDKQAVTVYFNNNGVLSILPEWESSDLDFNGHLAVGDINNDGFPDLAVSVFRGSNGIGKGYVKIYMNNNGILSSIPAWSSEDSMYTFSCAFGDMDNDGFLDLAVACGDYSSTYYDNMRVYKNENGVMQTQPFWKSSNLAYGMDVDWADINKDGKLDLIFACTNGPSFAYLNYGDSIGHLPYWTSGSASMYSNSMFLSDVNNDGNIDLALSGNSQTGSIYGKFKIYLNTGVTFNSNPYWSSEFSGYGSGIALADVNYDGWNDMICGGWGTPILIYANQNGTFQTTPQWTSSTISTIEAISCADYNNDGVDTLTATFNADGSKKLFYLPRNTLNKIISAKFGNNTVPISEYCFNLENGWIAFKAAPANSVQVSIKYIASRKIDFAVTNWDNTAIGNYIFNNNSTIGIKNISNNSPGKYILSQNYPNPFNPSTIIGLSLKENCFVSLKVYDLLGKEIESLVNNNMNAGKYELNFDANNLPGGIYFYRLEVNSSNGKFTDTKKMILIK